MSTSMSARYRRDWRRLISNFCWGHDLYCGAVSGIYVGAPAYQGGAVGISPTRNLIFGINEDSGTGTRGALPAGGNKGVVVGITRGGKRAQPWRKPPWGQLDCTWWRAPADVRGSPKLCLLLWTTAHPCTPPLRSHCRVKCCAVQQQLSVGDTVQAGSHCLLQLKHISDQTAAHTSTPSSSSGFSVIQSSIPSSLGRYVLILCQIPWESLLVLN